MNNMVAVLVALVFAVIRLDTPREWPLTRAVLLAGTTTFLAIAVIP